MVLDLRNQWGMSQERFANVVGLSQATIFKIENSSFDKMPKHETLMAIANALNLEYWMLIKKLSEDEPIRKTKVPVVQVVADILDTESLEDLWKIQEAVVEKSKKLR